MRNVDRGSKPASLVKNAATWTRELLQEIKNAESDGTKVEDKYYSKYNKADVKKALEAMYGRRCCYCEAQVRVVTKGHIEHRKPKKGPNAFPKLTFEWDNLHLACPACNQAKGKKWNAANEILDAVNDRPIAAHLTYEIEGVGVFRSATPTSRRGKTTVEPADLNNVRWRSFDGRPAGYGSIRSVRS